MKKRKDLFREIILWVYGKREEGFFWVDLEKEFSLTRDQLEWAIKILRSNMPISDNLVDHLRYDATTNADKFFITSKGITVAKSYMDTKSWYEKPIGSFFIGVLTTVVAGYILFQLGWI